MCRRLLRAEPEDDDDKKENELTIACDIYILFETWSRTVKNAADIVFNIYINIDRVVASDHHHHLGIN